jgi:hypothetical protein
LPEQWKESLVPVYKKDNETDSCNNPGNNDDDRRLEEIT